MAAATGLAVFLAGSYRALSTADGRRDTLWAVRLAVIALGVTVVLGLMLALSRVGWVLLDDHLRWADIHVAWGLAGWVGLLLSGIGMELIPLFYISPPFATWLKRALPLSVIGMLLLIIGYFSPLPPAKAR